MARKMLALVVVLAWGAFWIFGYLALSTPMTAEMPLVISCLLAGAGFLIGIFSYILLCRQAGPVARRSGGKFHRPSHE